jgi:DNA repair protein RadC
VVGSWLKLRLSEREYEAMIVLFLDAQHRLIEWEEVGSGTINKASVYPREIVKSAMSLNNHPSGVAEPSIADRVFTDRLATALSLVEVQVLDHFVIGHGDPVSFRLRGWLDPATPSTLPGPANTKPRRRSAPQPPKGWKQLGRAPVAFTAT